MNRPTTASRPRSATSARGDSRFEAKQLTIKFRAHGSRGGPWRAVGVCVRHDRQPPVESLVPWLWQGCSQDVVG
eukprot:5480102-Pyramimonas_sp.AAC.1